MNLIERVFMISVEQDKEISKLARSIGASRSAVLRVFLSFTKPMVHTKPLHLSCKANIAPENMLTGEDIEDSAATHSVGLDES